MFVSLPFQVWLFRSSLVLRYVCLSGSFVCVWGGCLFLVLLFCFHCTAQDTGYQDELCNWLDEAVSKTPKPSNWKADTVQEFASCNVLGMPDVGKKLVVRTCYTQLYELITNWLKQEFAKPGIKGVFAITGTPGIGKSVFWLMWQVVWLKRASTSSSSWAKGGGRAFQGRPSRTMTHGRPNSLTTPKLFYWQTQLAVRTRSLLTLACVVALRHSRRTTTVFGNRLKVVQSAISCQFGQKRRC